MDMGVSLTCGFGPDDILPFAVLNTLSLILDENGVSRRNRLAVVPLWFIEYLREEAHTMRAAEQVVNKPYPNTFSVGSASGFTLLLGCGTLANSREYTSRVLLLAGIELDPPLYNQVIQLDTFLYQTTLCRGQERYQGEH